MSESPSNHSNICQVCGDQASIINYGVLTCSSCRTFFRRNGFHTKKISPCRLGGHCQVTKTNRRCTACRFAKCLSVGMNRNLIRKEDLSINKQKPIESNLLTSLITDNTSWNSNEWNIISNIVHAFETFNSTKEIHNRIEMITQTASNIQLDSNQSCQIISSFSNCLQLFICSTPDFQVLTISEQWSLFQRNFFSLLAFGGIYLMGESGIFDSNENSMILQPLYGMEILRRIQSLYSQYDSDSVLIKIILVALAFSSSCRTKYPNENEQKDCFLSGTFRLYGSQNVYVELIWKYLNHRYEYQQSVQRFSLLIQHILNALNLSIETYQTNPIYQRLIDQIEQSFIINEQTNVPLWGKS